jgi:CHAD domain-containing protein
MEHSALSVALLRQRLVSLLKAMPAAQAGDETSVHQARVASRRLRQALPLLGVRADADALDRAGRRVRRITRALGPVRELDVTLLLLCELEKKGAAPARAIGRVRSAVIEERQERRREMLAAIKPSKLNKLRKRLVQVAAPEKRPVSKGSALAEANAQAAVRAAQLKTAIEHAGGMYLADRLHRVRVAAKKLRYALEIQRELTRSRSTVYLNRTRLQQDLLGRMHDLEILIDRARGAQARLAPRDRRGMAELKALIRILEDECRAGHAAYMQAKPTLLRMCDQIIANAGSPSAKASASAKATADKSGDAKPPIEKPSKNDAA